MTTPFTFSSNEAGVTVTPAFVEHLLRRTCRTAPRARTCTTIRSGFARSATPVIALRVARLDDDLQRVRREHHRLAALPPASVSFVMLLSSADANTSAGAPSLIWVTRSDDAAKLNVTFASGLLGHERVADLGERSRQRRRREHRDIARHRRCRGGRGRACVSAELASSEPHAGARKLSTATAEMRSRGVPRMSR